MELRMNITSSSDDPRSGAILHLSGCAIVVHADRGQAKRVAAEIVRRYNAEPKLLESLREYVLLEKTAPPYSASPLRQRAEAAIAVAEGRETS
jgi:hypothetical protein